MCYRHIPSHFNLSLFSRFADSKQLQILQTYLSQQMLTRTTNGSIFNVLKSPILSFSVRLCECQLYCRCCIMSVTKHISVGSRYSTVVYGVGLFVWPWGSPTTRQLSLQLKDVTEFFTADL